MEEVNKITEFNGTDKKLHISDVSDSLFNRLKEVIVEYCSLNDEASIDDELSYHIKYYERKINKTKSPIKEFLLSSGFRFNGIINDIEQYLKNVSDDNDIQLCVYLNNEKGIYKVYLEDVYQEDIKTLEDLKYILNKLSIRFS
jgi:hypothetical protein